MPTLPLRAALKRGALVTAANWPVVLIDFTIESLYWLALAVPVIGGALMVAVLVGADLGDLLAGGMRATADLVFNLLAAAPAALVTFLVALALVALGGEVLMFVVKAGTLHVLAMADRQAGEMHDDPIGVETLASGRAFSLEAVFDGARRFGPRAVRLALALGLAYALIGTVYLTIVLWGFGQPAHSTVAGAWPLLVLTATSGVAVSLTVVNLAYGLVRAIVVTDDCGVSAAFVRLVAFVVEDARQVIGIFGVMWVVVVLASAIALLATAGVTLVASMPVLGLLVVPLQAAAWIVRGLVFQFMNLATLSAYQTQYRRTADARDAAPASPTSVSLHA